jgi:coenzyme F420-reducing hydrogenase gamma subunit
VTRPTLAVWKFASCDGCQLTLLDMEDDLLPLAGTIDIADFREATSAVTEGPYDLSLVEGSITTPHDAERIQEIRRNSKALVTIGACAHVAVDFELRGCPIDKRQLLEVVTAFLAGRRPGIPATSVCTECKRRGLVCVMVAHGTPCLGPVTQAGCGALCPSYDRGCYGCFGPMESPNTGALVPLLRRLGRTDDDVHRLFRTFNAGAEPFQKAAARE